MVLILISKNKARYQQNWDSLRLALARHFLNRTWLNTQKSRAMNAKFRQSGYSNERPTDYLYRKVKLLNMVGNWTHPELIIKVMRGVPSTWNTILNTANMDTLEQLANEMEYYNAQLIEATSTDNSHIMRRIRDLEKAVQRKSHRARANEAETIEDQILAEANLIGQKPKPNSNNFNKTKPPPADHVVSKGQTPEMKGGRPC